MSWMDSWSRPSKHAAVPPPLYLTSGENVPYCLSCGRVMSSKKSQQKQQNVVKYCSDRCRRSKPGPKDKRIEQTIVALLDGVEDSGIELTAAKSKIVKGDHRLIVTMDEIEEIVFGSRYDPTKVFGRRKNRASRVISKGSEEDSDSGIESDDDPYQEQRSKLGPRIRPPQTESDVNFSVGGERGKAEKIEESATDLEKRKEGDRKAEEREMIRRAARRGIVFGFLTDGLGAKPHESSPPNKKKSKDKAIDDADSTPVENRRKCEALMNGAVVEPSFAKGNWSIRWREEH